MRKAEILVAAETLFQHYGFVETTVADIAREAGIGVGTVYLEFSSKDSISATLCRQHREEILQSMQAVINSSGNYSERFVQVLEARQKALAGSVREGLHGSDVLFAACEATRQINRNFDEAESRLLAKFLQDGNQAGAFSVPDVSSAAGIILRIYDTICSQRPSDGFATLHALVLGGVLRRVG